MKNRQFWTLVWIILAWFIYLWVRVEALHKTEYNVYERTIENNRLIEKLWDYFFKTLEYLK